MPEVHGFYFFLGITWPKGLGDSPQKTGCWVGLEMKHHLGFFGQGFGVPMAEGLRGQLSRDSMAEGLSGKPS